MTFQINHTGTILFLIILLGLGLRIFTAGDLKLHAWDERYHALVAKNMMNEPFKPKLYREALLPYDYKDWQANHIWLHKQPFPLWSIALSYYAFGVHEWSLRLPSVLLSVIGIWLTFYIARYLYNKRIGLVAAFLFAIHGLIIELAAGRVTTDHVDIHFMFFILLAVFFAVRFVERKSEWYNVLCGLSIGIAILCKWLPALIVLPLWLILVVHSRQFSNRRLMLSFAGLVGIVALTFLPWQIYIHSVFPEEAAWERLYNFKHITDALEGHEHPFYFHFDVVRILYGELIYIPMGWLLYKLFKRPMNPQRLIPAVWIFIPLIFFTIAKTKMQAYTLFAAPALFMLTAYCWHYLYVYRRIFRFTWLVNIVLVLLIALPIRYSIERIKPFSNTDRNPAWAKELRILDELLTDGDKTVLFNMERPVETMFYTDAIAYQLVPDTSQMRMLLDKGYLIYQRSAGIPEDAAEINEHDIVLEDFNAVYRRLTE